MNSDNDMFGKIGRAFWDGGIFGVAKTRLNEKNHPAPPPPPKVFVFGPDCPMDGLKPWAGHLRKIKEELPEETDLLELSRAMLRSGINKDECKQWANIAHEIRELMGVENLCEVPVRIEL